MWYSSIGSPEVAGYSHEMINEVSTIKVSTVSAVSGTSVVRIVEIADLVDQPYMLRART